jgi:hypothetical protein
MSESPYKVHLECSKEKLSNSFIKNTLLKNYFTKSKVKDLGISILLLITSCIIYFFKGLSTKLFLFIIIFLIPLGQHFIINSLKDIYGYLDLNKFFSRIEEEYDTNPKYIISLFQENFQVEKVNPNLTLVCEYKDIRRLIYSEYYLLIEIEKDETIFLTNNTFENNEVFNSFSREILKKKKENKKFK